MIVDSVGVWPFLQHTYGEDFEAYCKAREIQNNTWREISEEHMRHLLECVPPRYFKSGFFVGEPANHDTRGVPIHSAVCTIRHGDGKRYYVRDWPLDAVEALWIDLTVELSRQGVPTRG